MEICRACLLTEQDMVALDEFCVTGYTLLTNLKVTLGDEKPQFFCQNCFNMIKVFIDFREKAISSDALLQDISKNTKPDKFSIDNIIKEENHCDDDNVFDCEDNYGFNDQDVCKNDTYEEVNVPAEKTSFQCVLCQKQFTDSIPLMEHLKEHKRGAKCKLCLEKVPLADLYAHTLQHLPHMVPPEQALKSQQVKLEVDAAEWEQPFFDNSAVQFEDVMISDPHTVKAEKKKGTSRKSDVKCKKKPKVSKDKQQDLLHCGLCKMKFECKELLSQHLEAHKYPGSATCRLCHEEYAAWPQLLAHRFAHLPTEQRRCHLCARRCFSETHMEFHYRNAHNDGEDKFLKCKHCLRPYANSRILSKHIRSVHGAKRFVCDHCNKSCTTKSLLAVHIASHGGGQRYVCDICGFSCKLKAGLKNHKMRHYPHRTFCKICERTFVDQAKADEHKLKCKQTRVICPECGKEFNKKSLSRHMQSHASAKAYKCERCGAAFRNRLTLKVHVDRHDGNRTQRCEHCDASFYSPSVLIKHRRVHTGEKPYVCKICHKGFTANHNLKVHMRVHGEDLIVKKNKAPQTEDSLLNS